MIERLLKDLKEARKEAKKWKGFNSYHGNIFVTLSAREIQIQSYRTPTSDEQYYRQIIGSIKIAMPLRKLIFVLQAAKKLCRYHHIERAKYRNSLTIEGYSLRKAEPHTVTYSIKPPFLRLR